MNKQKYTFGIEGQMHFLKPAIESQGNFIEPFFESDDWEYKKEYFQKKVSLKRSTTPTALGGVEAVGIVMVFISSCFAKKIFDEVYDRLFKRPIGVWVENILKNINIPKGKHVEYRDIMFLEDIDLAVVVRLMVEEGKTNEINLQLARAHRIAYDYIKVNGRMAPIHCHSVVSGKINVEPELFISLEHIKKDDMKKIRATRKF